MHPQPPSGRFLGRPGDVTPATSPDQPREQTGRVLLGHGQSMLGRPDEPQSVGFVAKPRLDAKPLMLNLI